MMSLLAKQVPRNCCCSRRASSSTFRIAGRTAEAIGRTVCRRLCPTARFPRLLRFRTLENDEFNHETDHCGLCNVHDSGMRRLLWRTGVQKCSERPGVAGGKLTCRCTNLSVSICVNMYFCTPELTCVCILPTPGSTFNPVYIRIYFFLSFFLEWEIPNLIFGSKEGGQYPIYQYLVKWAGAPTRRQMHQVGREPPRRGSM